MWHQPSWPATGVFTRDRSDLSEQPLPNSTTTPSMTTAIEGPTSKVPLGVLASGRVLFLVLAFTPMVLFTVTALLFRHHVQDLNDLGYLGVFLGNLMASGTVILPVPGLAAAFAAAALWNPLLVALTGFWGAYTVLGLFT